jgi:hypothetical protein
MASASNCPSCGRLVTVPPELLGRVVRCPSCRETFTPSERGPASEPRTVPADAYEERRPGRGSPAEEDDDTAAEDTWEEDDDRPRRRRGRRGRAREAVAGPAIALMVVGGLALGISGLALILNLVLGGILMGAQPPNRPGGPGIRPGAPARRADPATQMVSGVVGSIVGLCWGGIVLSGGLQMKRLQSYGYAMTGAIVAMLPCNLCCLLGVPFGIWALVVLNGEGMKGAFE